MGRAQHGRRGALTRYARLRPGLDPAAVGVYRRVMPVPGPLVSTQWLADHLGGEHLVVLDATVLSVEGGGHVAGDEEFLVHGHVPGAHSADLLEQFSDPEASFSFTRPSRERFERAAGEHGISNETTVIVYDTASGQWASRLWCLLRSFGHDDVAVLDGGLTQWRHEGRQLETGYTAPAVRTFVAQERPGSWADKHEVEEVVAGARAGALVCAVPAKEFSGEAPVRRRAGHRSEERRVGKECRSRWSPYH